MGLVSNKTFVVEKNKKYRITERTNANVPVELQKEGRVKQGAGFFEPADIPYDEMTQKYDTGLDKTSEDFIGLSPEEVEKILTDRKELVEYHRHLVESHPKKDERAVVAANRMNVWHNQLVNTSSIVWYYRLYLAMRGKTLVPIGQKGNLANRAMYQISDEQAQVNHKEEVAKNRMKAEQWLYARLGTTESKRKEALEYLRYEGILSITQTVKEDALLMDLFKRNMESYDKLTSFLRTVNTVPADDVYVTNDVTRAIAKGVIRKATTGVYIYDNTELGVNAKDIVRNLKKEENKELSLKLFNNAEKKTKK